MGEGAAEGSGDNMFEVKTSILAFCRKPE